MHRDTFAISMLMLGNDGIDYDVDGTVVVEWFPVFVADQMYPTIVSALFGADTIINGKVLAPAALAEWQKEYHEDYREHLEWLVRCVIETYAED